LGKSARTDHIHPPLERGERLAEAFAGKILDLPPAGFGVRPRVAFGAVQGVHDDLLRLEREDEAVEGHAAPPADGSALVIRRRSSASALRSRS
jgi:hypothetical protein